MGTLKTAVVGLGLGRHFVRTLAGHPDVDRLVLCDPVFLFKVLKN